MKKTTLIGLLTLSLLLGSLGAASSARAEEDLDRAYLKMVMNIFSTHLQALEFLTANQMRYSDNVVRHAAALRQTTGLLDHAIPQEEIRVLKTTLVVDEAGKPLQWGWKDARDFMRLADASYISTKKLAIAAREWLKSGDRTEFMAAMENVKQACRNCHGTSRDWP